MAELDEKFKKSTTQVDDAIGSASTDESVNRVTEADVSAARKEAGSSVEKTIDKVDENQTSQIDSRNQGASGKKLSSLFRRVTGKMQSIQAGDAVRTRMSFMPDRDLTISDADHQERNAAMAEAAFENVQSDIRREATRSTVNGEETVIGVPSDTNVYSEESTTMSETVVGRTTYYPGSHPLHRSNGTLLQRGHKMVSVSGDYLFTPDFGSTVMGHDGEKAVGEQENLLFNRLGPNGAILRQGAGGGFVMPKRGRFWIRGFSPLPNNASPMAITVNEGENTSPSLIGTVTRTNGAGESVEVPVYQAPRDSQGVFDVVDLTPIADQFTQATVEAARLLTCAKSKFTLGQAEAIAQIFSQAQQVVDAPDEVIKWPEYAYADRSTLNSIHGVGTAADFDVSCYNEAEQFVEFMHYLEESEIMHAMPRINVKGYKDNLKFHRGMEGMNSDYPYWRYVFKGDPNTANNVQSPTLAAYAATKTSPRRFNSMAKWLYTFRTFWYDLDAYCSVIDAGIVRDSLLSLIKVQKDAVDEIIAELKIGTLQDADNSVSAGTIFAGNQVDLILGFDPNDLIDYTRTGNYITVWPTCGYMNAFTRTSAAAAQQVTYHIEPTWIQILMCAMNSQAFTNRLLLGDANLAGYFTGARQYANIAFDTQVPHWFDMYYLEALTSFKERVFSPKNQVSGYLRYLKAEQEFKIFEVLADDLTPISQFIDSVINDGDCYLSPNATQPSDFAQLADYVIRSSFSEPYGEQLLFMADLNANSGENAKLCGFALQPPRELANIYDLQGWECAPGSEADFVRYGNVDELLASDLYTIASDSQMRNGIVMAKNGGSGNPQSPLFFRRVINPTATHRFEMLQFDADARPIGYEDNPQDYLYAYDGFQNLQPCDYYVLMVHYGPMIDDNQDTNVNPVFGRFFLAPFVAGDTAHPADTTGHIVVSNDSRTIGLLSRRSGAHNALHGTGTPATAVNTIALPTDATYSRMMSLPSLYGYKRFVPAGVTNIQRVGKVENRRFTNLHTTTAGFAVPAARWQNPQLYLFMPHIENEQYSSKLAASDADVLPRYIDTTSPSDWRWYSSQRVLESGFAGVNIDQLIPVENGIFNADKHTVYDWANLPVILAMVGENQNWEDFATIVNARADANQDVTTYYFGYDIDPEAWIAFNDTFEHRYNQLLFAPDTDYIVTTVNDVTGDVEILFCHSVDALRNPQTRSVRYRNDLRDFLTDRPVERLNRNWHAYGMTEPLFVKQFRK